MLNKRLHENKFKRAVGLLVRPVYKRLMPIHYVKSEYRYITHHKCNLNNPVRYTEKLQYLRLYVYPKDPLVIKAAGRKTAREYVKETIGEEYLIPSFGTYERVEDIPADKLEYPCILKCTHASSFNKIVYSPKELKSENLRKTFSKWLKTDYGKKTVERHYSKIKPEIIVEKLLLENNELPHEYKIHVFNGKAKNLYMVSGRGKDIRYDQFYIDWTPFQGSQFNGWLSSDKVPSKPANFDEMVKVAEKLAKPFPFVRVDLFSINNKIYFNEMTFTPAKGTLIFDDDQADFEQGEWLDISKYLKASAK